MSIWVQVMLYLRPSRSVDLVIPSTACFVAVYGAEWGRGVYAEMEPLLMMRPPCGICDLKIRTASRVQRNVPMRLMFVTCWNFSSESSSMGTAGALMPAFCGASCS